MARDFGPNESLKNAGILCVFQVLQTAQLGQKIRRLLQANGSLVTQELYFKYKNWRKNT